MSARPKVAITDFVTDSLDCERRILGDLADIVALDATHESQLAGRVDDADVVLVYHTLQVTKATIQRLKNCRLIVRCGVGYDNVDITAARERGIDVANVPDYGTEDVADTALAMAMTLARGVHFLNSRLRRQAGAWSHLQIVPEPRLRGRTFGIIGMGRIGTAAALRAKAFGFDVAIYDPYVPDGAEKAVGVRRCGTLGEMLGQSHIVSAHCPLTKETRHILNAETIAQMPPSSILVNTSRGGVVDVLAVLDSVTRGHLGGAGIDVLETEPPADDHPLIKAWRDPAHPAHDRIILNPHAAFYSEEGLVEMRVKGVENCRRVLLGQPPRNVVNVRY